MSKRMRGLVLGAMLAVLSSAPAAAFSEPPISRDNAVQQFRAGERASLGQPVGAADAVQRFRAGERASLGQPVGAAAPVSPAGPDGQNGTPVALLAALAAAAILSLGLDAMLVRRKARRAAHQAT